MSFVNDTPYPNNRHMKTTGVRLQTSKPFVFELERGKVIWVSDGSGLELLCHTGSLWVTEGDAQDIVLHAGERLAVDRRRRALVHAMDDSRLTVRPGGWATHRDQRS
jgi:hypothetical protein